MVMISFDETRCIIELMSSRKIEPKRRAHCQWLGSLAVFDLCIEKKNNSNSASNITLGYEIIAIKAMRESPYFLNLRQGI